MVVVRDDMHPISFAHPALFKPGPIVSDVAAPAETSSITPEPIAMHLGAAAADAATAKPRTWRSIAAAKKAQADAARRAVVNANAEVARSAKALRIVEGAKRKAEEQLQDIESALSNDPERLSDERNAKLDETKEKAQAKLQ